MPLRCWRRFPPRPPGSVKIRCTVHSGMAGMLWDGKFLEIGSRRAFFERKQNPLALTAGRKAQKAIDTSRLYITPDKILTWLDQGLKRWRWFMSGTHASLAHICLNTCPFFEDHMVSFEDILGHHLTCLDFFACGRRSQYHQETSHGLTSKKSSIAFSFNHFRYPCPSSLYTLWSIRRLKPCTSWSKLSTTRATEMKL